MKELKFMQNSFCTDSWKIGKDTIPVKIITTMKRLEVYFGSKLIGQAGVVREDDFDYNTLLAFAQHKSGSQINVN